MTSSYPLTFYNFVTFNVIFATASVYIALNVAVIGLRLFSSWKRHNRLAMGDWCGLLATVCGSQLADRVSSYIYIANPIFLISYSR